jgi:hypothetical protein
METQTKIKSSTKKHIEQGDFVQYAEDKGEGK